MQQDKYEADCWVEINMGIHVIMNNRFEVSGLGALDFIETHQAAIKAYYEAYRFKIFEFAGTLAETVITDSSVPIDHPLFHTGWAVLNCKPLCKEGGKIIWATPCPGYGSGPGFPLMDLMKGYLPPSRDNTAGVLQAFHSKEKEFWAGCLPNGRV